MDIKRISLILNMKRDDLIDLNLDSCIEKFNPCLLSNNPKPGFGKKQTGFLTAQKVNKGYTCTCTTNQMFNVYTGWPGLAQVYRLERQEASPEQLLNL